MTHEEIVMAHLREHNGLTQAVAFDLYGITRLAAVIWKLRHKRGFPIKEKRLTGKNRFGVPVNYSFYYLA